MAQFSDDHDDEEHEDFWIACPNCSGLGHEMDGLPCEECDGNGGWWE